MNGHESSMAGLSVGEERKKGHAWDKRKRS